MTTTVTIMDGSSSVNMTVQMAVDNGWDPTGLCRLPASNVNNTCVCPNATHVYASRAGYEPCILNPCTDPASYWNTTRCYCYNTSLHLINGVCKDCLDTEVWDDVGYRCVCKTGTINVNGICRMCSTNSYINALKGCKCNAGYFGDGFTCQLLRPVGEKVT